MPGVYRGKGLGSKQLISERDKCYEENKHNRIVTGGLEGTSLYRTVSRIFSWELISELRLDIKKELAIQT